ncbi:hypothetical protein LTR33_017689 [Friedmanniomyces endolithicus]|nr:hypothetical protein LTR33_017689 [Friedmanniomyces endolithicus]
MDASAAPETPNSIPRASQPRLPVTHSSHPQHAQYPRGAQQPFRHRMLRRARMYLHTRPTTTTITQVGGERALHTTGTEREAGEYDFAECEEAEEDEDEEAQV